MHPPWVASMMRATCDRVDDVKDAGEIERLFMALDAALVHSAAPAALIEAVDVWPLLFERLERMSGQPSDPCAYASTTQLIQHVWRRCQGDVERHLVEPVLAAERAMQLYDRHRGPQAVEVHACRRPRVAPLVPRASDAHRRVCGGLPLRPRILFVVARRATSFALRPVWCCADGPFHRIHAN